MAPKLIQVTEEALRLSQAEQLRLARTLIERNEINGEPGTEAAWEEEIERRVQMIDAGLAKGRPFADVVREIDRQLAE